ncbi:MAG TPA: DUF938 domain-containing protein [Gammaproteobacteria bacterium]|nr:DUF938 domain-containing protein [Gammaproteobacteria bacterium]
MTDHDRNDGRIARGGSLRPRETRVAGDAEIAYDVDRPTAHGKPAAGRFGESCIGSLLSSPAAERNKEPILNALRGVLPKTGLVLEIASGTGQHIAYFAAALPALDWQPSDADPELLAVIEARISAEPRPNLRRPLRLDVLEPPWPVTHADAVLCFNMIHIAPAAAAPALLAGAAAVLSRGGPLVLYGPFRRHGRHTAPSNEAFDRSLKARDPDWGVRDLEEVVRAAEASGIAFEETMDMPANNCVVVFRRT